jgi:hypothetical protein
MRAIFGRSIVVCDIPKAYGGDQTTTAAMARKADPGVAEAADF